MKMKMYDVLSREISYLLRHAANEYKLEIDKEGWVEVSELIEKLNEQEKWSNLKEEDLNLMILTSDKKRHEILNGKIRALYGHSLSEKIIKKEEEPPEILYHGTSRQFIVSIKEKGLLPQKRQYVHLSLDIETALTVGKRKDSSPVILKIRSQEAYKDGVKFYRGDEKVFLADVILSKYIEF